MNLPVATAALPPGLCFVDTNVLLYAVDDRAPPKRDAAERLVAQLQREQRGVVSTQVMLELAHNLARKFQVSKTTAALMTAAYAQWRVVPADAQLVLKALARAAESQLSVWDAMVVEAALLSGAQTLFTEDLGHGQRFGPLTIVNPFLPTLPLPT
ncbi:PIN domain-containing protein [Paracidovorax sp. MALMAid1276]|uniref:PIN domain-containing protein n=1 Tax=Paracidovorax sp. MALMAid1276 TaxID=3411631 RepID=UPI003B991ADF